MLDPLNEGIRSRRVTRAMSATPLDSLDLSVIMRSANHAPSAGNRRLQTATLVTEALTLRRLRAISPGMLPVPQAAAVISVDLARAAEWGFPPDAPGLYVDVGTMLATLLLAAEGRGVGACPVASFSRAAAARILALPDAMVPRIIVCFGHPAASQPPEMASGRDPLASKFNGP